MDQRAPPPSYDLSSKKFNIRTQFKDLFAHLAVLGQFTTECFRRYAAEEAAYNALVEAAPDGAEMDAPTTFLADQDVRHDLQTLFDAWKEFFVINTDSIHEVRMANGHRYTLSAYIFMELTRLHYLLHKPELLSEQDNLACFEMETLSTENYLMLMSISKTKHSVWVEIANSYQESLDKDEESDDAVVDLQKRVQALWLTPIMEYTQSQVRILLWFLTQQINLLSTVDKIVVDEFKRVFTVLWLRIGQFYEQTLPITVLDEHEEIPADQGGGAAMAANNMPTMAFSVFSALYAGGLVRRLLYYDMLSENRLQIDLRRRPLSYFAEAAQKWVHKIVIGFADEAFADMFGSIVPEGYNFMGDDQWFKFYWPHKIHSRAACINSFRPHLHKRLFSEAELNRETVLKAYKTNHVSRLFILKAVDEYLKIQLARIEWMNAVVVYNEDIEYMSTVLEQSKVPVILQVFSSFWLYDGHCVHVADDLFEVIGLWFWLIRTKYKSMVYNVSVEEICQQVFS